MSVNSHYGARSSSPRNALSRDTSIDEKLDYGLEENIRSSEEDTMETLLPHHDVHPKNRRRTHWLTALNILISFISISLFSFTLSYSRGGDFNAVAKSVSYNSPILNELPIHQDTIRLNGTLFPASNPSWSRLPPGSPIGEAGWESAAFMRLFPISSAEVHSLGKDTAHVARFDPTLFPSLGSDAYVATLDFSHQVHCLNELRKMAFVDYPYEKGDDGGDWDAATGPKLVPPMTREKKHSRLFWIHLRHCTDMLLQNLLCHADTELFTFGWMDTQELPFPDFNINRVCRRWEDLIEWRDERAEGVDMDVYEGMKRPDGVRPMEMSEVWYRMAGYKSSVLFDKEGRLASKWT